METDPPTKMPKPDGQGELGRAPWSPTQESETSKPSEFEESEPDEELDLDPTKH